MKKIIVLILCAGFCSAGASAKGYNATHDYGMNEIGVSYGASALGFAVTAFSGIAADLASEYLEDFDFVDVKSRGSYGFVNVSYMRSINKTFSFGASCGFTRSSLSLISETPVGRESETLGIDLFTIMGNMKVNWFQNRGFGMYSKLGLGVMHGRLTCQRVGALGAWGMTGHLSILGIEFGGRVRGFMELGPGFQGWGQAGLKVYF